MEEAAVRVVSLVPWVDGLDFGGPVEVSIVPGTTRVREVLERLGVKDRAIQSLLLVIVDGRTSGLDQSLRGGEKITITTMLSGG